MMASSLLASLLCHIQGTVAFLISVVLFLFDVAVLLFQTFLDVLLQRNRRHTQITDRVCVITGASGGFGRETAMLMAGLGARLALMDIDQKGNQELADELSEKGTTAIAFQCDVTDPRSVEDTELKIRMHPELGPADILICNAGVLYFESIAGSNVEHAAKTINVNLLGYYWTVRAFLGSMIERRSGHICAISSIAGHYGSAMSSAYCASKFGIRGLMESLEWELYDLGLSKRIHTTIVYPFLARTPMVKNFDLRSALVNTLTADEAAEGIVKSIIGQKSEAFIPWYTAFLGEYVKPLMFHRLKLLCRDRFGIHPERKLKPVVVANED